MSGTDHLTAAKRIRSALELAADALVGARLDDLLAAERSLASAVAAWPSGADGRGIDREALRHEMRSLEATLARCRRLGAALAEVAGQSSGAGGERGYDRSGAASSPAARAGRALEARA